MLSLSFLLYFIKIYVYTKKKTPVLKHYLYLHFLYVKFDMID